MSNKNPKAGSGKLFGAGELPSVSASMGDPPQWFSVYMDRVLEPIV